MLKKMKGLGSRKMKPILEYFIIRIDEPYAEEIYGILKRGQRYTLVDSRGKAISDGEINGFTNKSNHTR